MINWNESKNKTLIGFHDIVKKKISFLGSKFPLSFDGDIIPFLTTRDSYFEFNQNSLRKYIEKKDREEYFNKIKNQVANMLIIPGLLVSIAYLLRYLGFFQQIAILETFVNLPIINTFFWISFLGVIALWHDYYQTKSFFKKLPSANYIPDIELEEIKAHGFKFARYSHLNPLGYISDEYAEYISSNPFNALEIFNKLLLEPPVLDLLKRANIEITQQTLEENKINKDVLPLYPQNNHNMFLLYSLEEALLTGSKDIQPIQLFLTFFKIIPQLSKLLLKLGSNQNILREITLYLAQLEEKRNPFGIINPLVPYYRTGGLAKNWIYGYTYILNQFSKDINEVVAKQSDTFGIGHEKEVEALVAVLGRASKKHALLVGEAGVGKSSLIKGLAQRINRGDVPPILYNTRIVQLDINGLIAYSSHKKNIEFFVQKAMKELGKAGNVILYIDELQELIPAKAAETGHSIADILLPYVTEGKFAIVGTVNYSDYKKYFYTNESFRQSFANIEVAELAQKDALRILQSKIPVLEKIHNIYITIPTIISCVELSQRYIHNRMLPDSAVSLLEDTCSWAQSNGVNVITNDHVAKILSIQTNITIGDISDDESEKLETLEERIKKKVVGQDEAVHIVSEALKRARADIRDPKRPIGAFLFLGPTGVGKTYLAKILSQEYFNNHEDIVRVDMSEYMDENSIDKLLGSTTQNAGSQTQVTLLDRVKSNPYTVVLFDEIEKASSKVLDLFLQLFEEGRLTSTNGETIDFTNTIIICTSNIGATRLLQSLEENNLWEETKSIVTIELKQAIRPELFNRFDSIVVFHPQKIEELTKISNLLLEELNKRLKEKNLELDWDATIPMLIANKAYEPGFGARPIRRYIQEKIEGAIAQEIISNKIKGGDVIKIKESWII